MRVYVCEHTHVQVPGEARAVRFPLGVTGSCEMPDSDAGNQTQASARAV